MLNKPSDTYFISLIFLLFGNPVSGLSQAVHGQNVLAQKLTLAKGYLLSFQNDSALLVFDQLIHQLQANKQLDTPLGLRIRFHRTEALEKDDRDEEALQELLYLKAVSQQRTLWDVYANTCITLARQYEKFEQAEDCIAHLRLAQSTITRYELDSIYPFLTVRLSSYYRVLASNPDSALYYAKEAVRTAPLYHRPGKEADGHLLLGHLYFNVDDRIAAYHYRAAAAIFQAVGDYAGSSYMVGSLARLHLKNLRLDSALFYNDATILASRNAIINGHERHYVLGVAYIQRSEIYEQSGQLDSALFFHKHGYQLAVDHHSSSNAIKVREIDARYRDEQKAQQIIEQAAEIESERKQRYTLIGLVLLILLLAGVLLYFYVQLHTAKHKSEAQAQLISQKNKDLEASLSQQRVLQSEVHHRVKNNLQVIISLLELQQEDINDPIAHQKLETMSGRIYSMAAIHELLYQQEDKAQIAFAEYTNNLCFNFSNFSRIEDKPLFQLHIGEVYFSLATSMPLGIILTELLTNSLKYGRVEGRKLNITIRLQQLTQGYCLSYKDNGPGFSDGALQEREGGLGTYLLQSMVRQLQGRIKSENKKGASYEIFFQEKIN